ncbi:MAG: 50S ribosomal protein L11 methyltransferase [Labilithrix sp.]
MASSSRATRRSSATRGATRGRSTTVRSRSRPASWCDRRGRHTRQSPASTSSSSSRGARSAPGSTRRRASWRARSASTRGLAGVTVLDIGCGSGVLALIALVLGAKDAVAVDIDAESIEVTKENAQRNHLDARIDASTTDLADVSSSRRSCSRTSRRRCSSLASEIARHVAPGGLLFLSGVLVPQRDDVRAAYADFELLSSPELGEWTLLALRKP